MPRLRRLGCPGFFEASVENFGWWSCAGAIRLAPIVNRDRARDAQQVPASRTVAGVTDGP